MPVLRLAFLLSFLVLAATAVNAHSNRPSSSNASGIAIPSMTHGELKVMRDHYGAILTLADSATESGPTFRKLENYTRIQNYYCLWGFMPRAITDEASPFNECSHAYLSASKMLLLHMRDMASTALAAAELTSLIDAEMVQQGLAFIGCEYSGETFHTGEIVTPHWENLPGHAPTIAAMSFPIIAAAGLLLLRKKNSPPARP